MLTILKDHPSLITVGQLAALLNCNQSFLILPYYNNQKKPHTHTEKNKRKKKQKNFPHPLSTRSHMLLIIHNVRPKCILQPMPGTSRHKSRPAHANFLT